jgi:NADH:ubiquinone oxidoreductase subunit F (NADH-binding)/NADH:ubiquinone oxidoreductase subunit E
VSSSAAVVTVHRRRVPTGPQPADAQALAAVREALGAQADLTRRDLLIEHLHRLQDTQRQLRTDHLAALAELMKLSLAEVHEVASFYHHFDLAYPDAQGRYAPAPALTVRVCDGIACELAGARELLGALATGMPADVRVVAAPCIGRCEQAPAAVVHRYPLAQATADAVRAAVDAGLTQAEPPTGIDHAAYVAQGGYAVLDDCLAGRRSADDVIATLEASALRGLGGAGFPAGRKWRIVRGEPGPRLMAVNIDEGEPGTFKDRHYLERDPHRFFEGMLIAAWAVGIDAIYLYLRDEYHGARSLLERELAVLQAQRSGLPRIELRRGAGAYICGEESAMIESIEGKRGMPRHRPPYVAQIGLFGRPTLEHNFETLYWVPAILQHGAAWFAQEGRRGRQGLRSFSVSGRVKSPGVKLAPAGITLRELIDEHCGGMADGHTLYGYLPGGASGGILPASLADVPLDFDTLQPHGAFIGSAAVVVFSQADRAVDVARNLMRFFEHESCGQCTPCRSGTAKASVLIAGPRWDAALLGELSQVMRDSSICGLGQAAPNPVDSVLRHFAHELTLPRPLAGEGGG